MALFLIGLWFQEMVAVVPWFWPLLCRAENFCLIKNTRKIKLSLSLGLFIKLDEQIFIIQIVTVGASK